MCCYPHRHLTPALCKAVVSHSLILTQSFGKSCLYLCKYVTVIDFSISEPIKGRKGDRWHFKDNKHIWCNALWFPSMFLTHNWRNRWLDFLGSLKHKLSQYETASLLNRVNPFWFFFFPNWNLSEEGCSFTWWHVPERLLHKRRTCFVEPGAFYFFWHKDLWKKHAHISPYTVIGTHYANCISIITN